MAVEFEAVPTPNRETMKALRLVSLPRLMSEFAKKRKHFQAWLLANGAEILEPTNPYEVLRFKANGVTSIVYRKEDGGLTWSGDAAAIFMDCVAGRKWDGTIKTATKIPRRSPTIKTLLVRDGPNCFFCGHGISPGEETIEHLVSRAHGGPHHLSNFALAHAKCNADAGHLSVMEKIRLREAPHFIGGTENE